jgi:hypothetical protein
MLESKLNPLLKGRLEGGIEPLRSLGPRLIRCRISHRPFAYDSILKVLGLSTFHPITLHSSVDLLVSKDTCQWNLLPSRESILSQYKILTITIKVNPPPLCPIVVSAFTLDPLGMAFGSKIISLDPIIV